MPTHGLGPLRGLAEKGMQVYACPNGHRFDRDFAASWSMLLKYFRSRREEIRELLRSLGPRGAGAPP